MSRKLKKHKTASELYDYLPQFTIGLELELGMWSVVVNSHTESGRPKDRRQRGHR